MPADTGKNKYTYFGWEDDAEKFLQKFDIGASYKCFVNPRDDGKIAMSTRNLYVSYWTAGVIMLLITLLPIAATPPWMLVVTCVAEYTGTSHITRNITQQHVIR